MNLAKIQLGRMSLLNLTGNGVRVLFSFVTTIVASRTLGADDFGIINLLLGYTVLLNYALTLGFDTSLPYFVQKYSLPGENASKLPDLVSYSIRSAFVVAGVVTLLAAGGAAAILHESGRSELILPAALTVFQCFFWSQASVILGFMRGSKRFIPGIVREQFLFPSFQLLSICAFVGVLKLGVWGYTLGFFLASFVSYVYAAVSMAKMLPELAVKPRALLFSGSKATKADRKEWLRFSLPLGIMTALEPVMGWLSIVMIGWFLPNAEVGVFAACVRLMIFVQFLLLATGPIVSTYLAGHFHAKRMDEFRDLYQKVTLWSARWSLLVSGCLMIGAEAVLGIFGPDYVQGVGVLAMLLPGFALDGAFGAAKLTLSMSGYNVINAANLVAAILFNLIAGILLTSNFGVLGASAALSLTYTGLNLARIWQLYRRLSVSPMNLAATVKFTALVVVVVALALGARTELADPLTRGVGAAGLFALILLLSAVLFAKDLLRKTPPSTPREA